MAVKRITILVFMALIVVLLLIFQVNKYEAKVVYKSPQGYIAVNELPTVSNGELECVFWEQQVSIVKSDGLECVFQTSIHNSDFVVKYDGVYYINLRHVRQGDG